MSNDDLNALHIIGAPFDIRAVIAHAVAPKRCFYYSIKTDPAELAELLLGRQAASALIWRKGFDKHPIRSHLAAQLPCFEIVETPFKSAQRAGFTAVGFAFQPIAPAKHDMGQLSLLPKPRESAEHLLEVYRNSNVSISNFGVQGLEPEPIFEADTQTTARRILIVGSDRVAKSQEHLKQLVDEAATFRAAYPDAKIAFLSNCRSSVSRFSRIAAAFERDCDTVVCAPWHHKFAENADLIVADNVNVQADAYLRNLPVRGDTRELFGVNLAVPNGQANLMEQIDRLSLWILPQIPGSCGTEAAFQALSAERELWQPPAAFNLAATQRQLHIVNHLNNASDFRGAAELLKSQLIKFPDDPELLSHLGQAYLDLDELAQAEDCFAKITALGRGNSKAHLQRAEIRTKMGHLDEETGRHFLNAISASGGEDYKLWDRYFNFEWEQAAVNERLIQTYQRIAVRYMARYPKGSNVGGAFLTRLAAIQHEAGLLYAAERTLKEATARGEPIGSYLRLHKAFWQTLGIKPPSKSRQNALAHMESNSAMFTDLLDVANGDIVIVGNGPQELGRGRGEEIDSHGLVVRFNTYSTAFPQSHDYGTKTDLWVRMPATGYVKTDDLNTCPNIMLTGSNRWNRSTALWGWIDAQITDGKQMSFIPKEPIYELISKLKTMPTAGMALAYMLYRETGPVDPGLIYGCSFAEVAAKGMGEYHHSDAAATKGNRHDFDVENAFFKSIVKTDQARYYLPAVQRALSRSIPTLPIAVPPAQKKPWSLAGLQGRYDRIVSVSNGLARYEILGVPVEVVSRGETKKILAEPAAAIATTPEDFPVLAKNPVSRHRTLVLGFGLGPTGQLGQQVAAHLGMHYASVEYGLISSCHLPSEKKFNFSLILDDIGAFFNTEHRSRLEMILDEGFGTETRALTDRARAFTDTVLKHNITKYNNAPNMLLAPRKKTEKGTERRRILVIDQTSGDLSIKYGQCEKYSFQDMLDHAMAQPDAEVFFKPHPETLAGAKGANFDIDVLRQREDLTVLEENCNIMSLMSQVDEVYVMVSGVGFEALMAGKTVRCFGVPFYAGRGLTIDMAEPARQRRPLSIEELVAGVYLKYHQFYDPDTRAPVTAEVCLDRLISKLPRKSGLIHDGTRSLQVDLTDPAEAEAYTEMLAGRIPPDVAAAAKLVALGDSIADVTDGSGFVSTCLADLGVYRIHAMSETDSTLDALTTLDHDVIRVHSDEGAISCDEPGNARVSKKTQSLGRLDHVLAGERLALLRVAPKKRAVDILKTAEGLMQDQPPAAILARLKPNELPSAAEFLSSWYGAPECLSTGKEQDGKTASLFLFQIKAPQGAEND